MRIPDQMKLDLKTRFDHKYGRWLNERTRRGPAEVSFLPPCFLLPWDTTDSRESASLLQWRIQGGGGRDPPSSYFFNPNWGPKDRKKFFWDQAPPVSQGLDDPPPLSEGQSEQIPFAFSIPLPWPKHSIISVATGSFCLCCTYNTSLSLFLSNRNGSLVISV